MNEQKIFDTVVRHLAVQGRRAWTPFSGCQYHTPDGLMCAVGCLIPEEAYTPSMEYKSVEELISDHAYSLPKYLNDNGPFLRDLQKVHDYFINWKSVYAMKRALAEVAENWNIKTDVFDDAEWRIIERS